MNESQRTSKVTSAFEKRGVYVIVLAGGNQFQKAGLPDRILCWRGKTIFVEFKGPATAVQANQRLTIAEIKARRCEAYIVRHLNNGLMDIDEQGFNLTVDELLSVLFGE